MSLFAKGKGTGIDVPRPTGKKEKREKGRGRLNFRGEDEPDGTSLRIKGDRGRDLEAMGGARKKDITSIDLSEREKFERCEKP